MPDKDLSSEVQQQILQEFKTNNQVFSKVYEFYYEMILRYLLKRTMSAEVAYDLTADTFMKAFETFHKFKWTGISVKVWLYRIAINSLKNYRRKPRTTVLTEEMENCEELAHEVKGELEALDKTLYGDADLSRLSDAVAALNPDYQNVISLYYFSEMTQEDIGKTINRSVSAVKSMMHRAMENLRQLLSPNHT